MWLLALIVPLAVGALLTVYAIWIEPNWLRVRRRVLYLDGWNTSLDGMTILHLSDLHAGRAALGIKLFAAVPLATIIVYQSINFHHYIVDGIIWKVRKQKLQENLGLAH